MATKVFNMYESKVQRLLEEGNGEEISLPFFCLTRREGTRALFLSDPRSTLDSLFHRSFFFIIFK